MGAAIWSCPIGTFAQFPIRFIVDFYHNHGLLNVFRRPTWRVVEGGSRTYVEAMTRNFHDRIRLRTPVQSVRRLPNRVDVQPRGGPSESFDHVIFACHSDQALRILGDDGDDTGTGNPVRVSLRAKRGRVAHRHLAAAANPTGVGELELSPVWRRLMSRKRHLQHEHLARDSLATHVLRDIK